VSWDWVSKLEELRLQGKAAAVVTVASHAGSTPREIGAKMIVEESGEFHGTIGGGTLESLALAEALEALRKGEPRFTKVPLGPATGQCCGGTVGLLIEVLQKGPKLFVFGAGHVGRAICQVLSGTPFEIHLVDSRREWLYSTEIPAGVLRHPEPWNAFVESAPWDSERTYAVVLTHLHALDQAILAEALGKPWRYLGLIGSRTKWERFRSRLIQAGADPSRLDEVTCPIGIALKGKSPKEIAVSFAAQVLEKIHELPADSARRGAIEPHGNAESGSSHRDDAASPISMASV
jgi:xanthine dehydrogenase accessory factor